MTDSTGLRTGYQQHVSHRTRIGAHVVEFKYMTRRYHTGQGAIYLSHGGFIRGRLRHKGVGHDHLDVTKSTDVRIVNAGQILDITMVRRHPGLGVLRWLDVPGVPVATPLTLDFGVSFQEEYVDTMDGRMHVTLAITREGPRLATARWPGGGFRIPRRAGNRSVIGVDLCPTDNGEWSVYGWRHDPEPALPGDNPWIFKPEHAGASHDMSIVIPFGAAMPNR
jgi:hypothetical protein